MAMLDLFALLILVTVFIAIVAVVVYLAMLPGEIAKARNHPQVEAIKAGGWLGLLTFGVLWSLALIWALTKTPSMLLAEKQDN